MVIVTYTNIESASDGNIRDIVDNRANIPDPIDPSGNRFFVYDSDPFNKEIGFKDMPYIVLFFPKILQSNSTADGKHKMVKFTQRLIVRSVRDGASNSKPNQGRTDFMQIKDDVMQTFNSVTIFNALKLLNITGIEIEKVNDDPTVISQEELYECEYEITYWNRMKVSV